MNPAFNFSASIYIGRFQPFHAGHAALLGEALTIAERCIVVIGSAFQARSPRNPFTWQERAEMIRLSLAPDERERMLFLPLRDFYDSVRWAAALREGVARMLGSHVDGHAGRIALVGHFKDASSDYLNSFPGWTLVSMQRQHAADATSLRNAYFGCPVADMDATLAALAEQVPASTVSFLREWSALPAYGEMVEEWRMLQR